MPPDWIDIEEKARVMKATSVRIIQISSVVNRGTIAGRSLHEDTLRGLKTEDGPVAKTEAENAWNDLDIAMNS